MFPEAVLFHKSLPTIVTLSFNYDDERIDVINCLKVWSIISKVQYCIEIHLKIMLYDPHVSGQSYAKSLRIKCAKK